MAIRFTTYKRSVSTGSQSIVLEPPYAIFKNMSDGYTVVHLSDVNTSSLPHFNWYSFSLKPGEEVRFDLIDTTTIYFAAPEKSSANSGTGILCVAYFVDDGM